MENIFTERAHLMCPNMYFGITLIIAAAYDEKRITDSIKTISEAHSFLNALLGHNEADNFFYYEITDSSKIELFFKDDFISSIGDEKLIKEYETITGRDWNLTKEGMLKVAAWKAEEGTAFLLVFHHLLADGRGALGLAKELADLYVKGMQPELVQEKLIASKDAFPTASKLSFISKYFINKANKLWEKENHTPLFYKEYHEFAERFIKNDNVRHSLFISDSSKTKQLLEECTAHSVTLNDLLMARMYLQDKTDKIIIAKDLRDSLGCYRKGALGNYATAFSVVQKAKGDDEFSLAAKVHKKVKSILTRPSDLYLVLQCYASLNPSLLDAAFMASQGAYKSKAASFIGKMFFSYDVPKGYSITNLGKIEDENINAAYFIPPASPAIRKTQGVLTVNGQMIICTSER